MLEKQFGKAADFIKSCNIKTSLFYDTDADGVTGGAVVAKVLKERTGNYPVSVPSNHLIPYITDATKNIYRELIRENSRKLITVDAPMDQDAEYVLKLAEKMDVLVIDHHQTKQDLSKLAENIVHINSNFLKIPIKPFNYCGSKLSYDICSQITDIGDLDWLAGAGIIGDYSGEAWKNFLDDIYKKHEPLKRGENPYGNNSDLGEIASLINSGMSFSGREGARVAFDACLQACSPEDILRGKIQSAKKLKEYQVKVKEEIGRLTENWEGKADIIEENKLIFYQLPTKMFVQPEVANRISHQKPDYTFIFLKDLEGMTYLSLRRTDEKVNCGELAMKSTRNLKNAGGGGHSIAAGGFLMEKDKEVFKKEVLNLTKK